MLDNWEKVLTTPLAYRAELARGVLGEHGIDAVAVNKQSSAYPPFGNIEVFVPVKDAILAKIILENETTFG